MALQITGHKTRSVLEGYIIVSDGELREAAGKLVRVRSAGAKHLN